MKIAIFGDSFAMPLWLKQAQKFPYYETVWHYQLSNKFDVDNFAKGGTGPEWSYSLIMEANNLDDYDKIIFLLSDMTRLLINPQYAGNETWIHKMPCGNEDLNPKDPYAKFIYKTTQNYFKYFDNPKIFTQRYYNIAKKLRTMFGKNVLILPTIEAEPHHKHAWEYYDIDFTLQNATGDVELTKKLRHNTYMFYEKFKFNHMTTQAHDILYNKIKEWIETGKFEYKKHEIPKINNEENEQWKLFCKYEHIGYKKFDHDRLFEIPGIL